MVTILIKTPVQRFGFNFLQRSQHLDEINLQRHVANLLLLTNANSSFLCSYPHNLTGKLRNEPILWKRLMAVIEVHKSEVEQQSWNKKNKNKWEQGELGR